MIYFHSETNFKLPLEEKVKNWINTFISSLNKKTGTINYIFCDDSYLLQLNKKHLKHDTYTDIISFDYSTQNELSGDIFISVERVKENAKTCGVSFEEEMHRILVHGVLHFVGYKDKNSDERLEMRRQEDYYLSLRDF